MADLTAVRFALRPRQNPEDFLLWSQPGLPAVKHPALYEFSGAVFLPFRLYSGNGRRNGRGQSLRLCTGLRGRTGCDRSDPVLYDRQRRFTDIVWGTGEKLTGLFL